MKYLLFLLAFLCLASAASAQNVYTIKADSVKLTNCDSSELIIENHTQGVPGFLYNTGNGRTIFKRGAQKLNNSTYLIGADTLKLPPNAWVQGGNSFGMTGILGTLDNNHLDFYTNSAFQARMSSLGDLLIGTITDNGQHRLQIYGGILTTSNASINGLTVGRGGDVAGLYNNTTSIDNTAIGYNTLVNNRAGVANTHGGYLSGSSLVNGSENTGLGRLSLYDNVSGSRNVAIGSAAGYTNMGSGNVFLGAAAGEYETGNHKLYIADTPTTSLMYGDFSTGQLQINENLNQGFLSPAKFIVNGDTYLSDSVTIGKVLTGTSADSILVINSPTHAIHKVAQSSLAFNGILNSSLAVNGTVSAKGLHLAATDWPDYVFDRSYRLLSLPEVAQYIQRYNHLPGIHSAEEVFKAGVDVGENQAALLKKIEELTLYAVGQEKRLGAQNHVNMQLERKLAVQAAEMEVLKIEMAELRKMILSKANKQD